MENQIELNHKKVMSFGEILIDVTLDESNDDTVKQLRVKFAEIANILKDQYNTGYKSPVRSLLFDHAVGELVSAQMAVEKVITINK